MLNHKFGHSNPIGAEESPEQAKSETHSFILTVRTSINIALIAIIYTQRT